MIAETFAVLSGLASIVGGIGFFLEARGRAEALRAQAEYQRRMIEKNKELAEEEGRITLLGAEKIAQEITKKEAQIMGAQAASYAAQGVELAYTPMQVIRQTAVSAVQDIEQVRANARRIARGLKIQAENYEQAAYFQSLAASREARMLELTGGLQLLGGIVGGVGSVGLKFSGKDAPLFSDKGKAGAKKLHWAPIEQDMPFGYSQMNVPRRNLLVG